MKEAIRKAANRTIPKKSSGVNLRIDGINDKVVRNILKERNKLRLQIQASRYHTKGGKSFVFLHIAYGAIIDI